MAFEGAQTASTNNFFEIFGHGSAPKLLFDTITKHFCLPTHFWNQEQNNISEFEIEHESGLGLNGVKLNLNAQRMRTEEIKEQSEYLLKDS